MACMGCYSLWRRPMNEQLLVVNERGARLNKKSKKQNPCSTRAHISTPRPQLHASSN
jgi:hypothetical protein